MKQPANRPMTIGICGITHKVGVTLVSFAFSNFLSGAESYHVACLELSGLHSFSSLSESRLKVSGSEKPFHYLGIDFYPTYNLYDLPHIQCQAYDLIILDFGILSRGTIGTFLDCDLCVVLGYVDPWNRTSYGDWILSHQSILNKKEKETIYLGNLANDQNVRQFRKLYGVNPVPVPYLNNPFQLTSGQFCFMESIFGKIDIPRKSFFPERKSHE